MLLCFFAIPSTHCSHSNQMSETATKTIPQPSTSTATTPPADDKLTTKDVQSIIDREDVAGTDASSSSASNSKEARWIERIYAKEFCNIMEVYPYEVYPFIVLYAEDFVQWCFHEFQYDVEAIRDLVIPAVLAMNARKMAAAEKKRLKREGSEKQKEEEQEEEVEDEDVMENKCPSPQELRSALTAAFSLLPPTSSSSSSEVKSRNEGTNEETGATGTTTKTETETKQQRDSTELKQVQAQGRRQEEEEEDCVVEDNDGSQAAKRRKKE